MIYPDLCLLETDFKQIKVHNRKSKSIHYHSAFNSFVSMRCMGVNGACVSVLKKTAVIKILKATTSNITVMVKILLFI